MPLAAYDLAPLRHLLLLGALLAALPLAWALTRRRSGRTRLQTLTLVTLFVCLDLVLLGAFTRLTDSGLGCPDWPGCYGSASPLGAHADIAAAHAALPSGAVSPAKAWIEMVHRYLAEVVGALCLALAVGSWLARPRAPLSPWWPTLTLLWVCVQGAFGALTVSMKLFPAIVSLHLLSGYGLLALLALQSERRRGTQVPLRALGRIGLAVGLLALLLQAALGAWVSTNYAVLACGEFPRCQGSWWPAMDFAQGFAVWRPLGLNPQGGFIAFPALTAIHVAHRLGAAVVLPLLAALACYLHAQPGWRASARLLGALLLLQLGTGLSNVVLDWPLLGAVLHTGGAGALLALLCALTARVAPPHPRWKDTHP